MKERKEEGKKRKVLLFVWGTLMRGQPNHERYMQNARFIDEGITEETRFLRTGFVSVFYFPKTDKVLGRIIGEVYEISEDDLKKIDLLEGYPDLYCRSLMKIRLLNKGETVEAWMYYFPGERFMEQNIKSKEGGKDV